MAQTVFFERFFEFGDESGQIALGLGQGKPAGGQSNAGHRVEAQSTLHVAIFDAVFGQQLFDRWTLRGRNIRNDQVLIGSEAEVAVVDFRDFAQSGTHRITRRIEHAATGNEKREV